MTALVHHHHAVVHLSRIWQVILALHIFSVVVGFGIVIAYPLFMTVGARLDPTAMAWFHQMQQAVSRRLVSPALVLVVSSGLRSPPSSTRGERSTCSGESGRRS